LIDPSPALFQLRNVHKKYGTTVAVDVRQFDIRQGGVLCLLGPTGAGKSTLLRMMAGVEKPSSGSVVFLQHPKSLVLLPVAARRHITMVFQRPVLLSGTVRMNVEYGLRLRQGNGFAAEKVDQMLARLGLAKLSGQSARTLSGGQSQLVALARALVLDPEVLLLDEPTANLDPAHVALVESTIAQLQRERTISVIWSTHNVFQARRVAQRVALMLNGRLVEAAETGTFFETPSDPRVKEFVEGRMIY